MFSLPQRGLRCIHYLGSAQSMERKIHFGKGQISLTNTRGFVLSTPAVQAFWIYPEVFTFLALKYLGICVFLKAKICLYLYLSSTACKFSPQIFDRVHELRRWNGSQGRAGERSGDDGIQERMTLRKGDGLSKEIETKSSAPTALLKKRTCLL